MGLSLRSGAAILFGLNLVFSAGEIAAQSAPASGGRTEFQAIDLTTLKWYGLADFRPEYARSIPPDAKLFPVPKFPVVINSLFKIPPGKGTRDTTLFTRFNLNNTQLRKPLALHMHWIGENWAVYVNGKLLRDEIHLDAAGEITKRRIFRRLNLPLEPGMLRPGENLLVIRFTGYVPTTSLEANTNHGFLFSTNYSLDTYENLNRRYRDGITLVLFAVYIFFGLYHLVLYAWRRLDVYNVFFGLFAILLAINIMTTTQHAQDWFADMSWINRVKYAAQAGLVPCFGLFTHYYFYPHRRPNMGILIMAGAGALLMVGQLFGPFAYSEVLLLLFHVTLIPKILFGAAFMVLILIRRERDSGRIGLSVLILVVTGVWDTVDDHLFQTGVSTVQYGFLVCILAVIGILARRFLRVHNESERLNIELSKQKDAFHRFVPTQFLEHLGKESALDIRAGDSALYRMSVLFCDMHSFTRLAEQEGPDRTFHYLNEYLQSMEPAIEKHHGFVDKYMGDAILALFSEHRNNGNGNHSADSALRAALDMERAVREMAVRDTAGVAAGGAAIEAGDRPTGGRTAAAFGIGINTGKLIMGTVGSETRVDTTVIGDAVNIAARLESLSRNYGARILISRETRDNLSNPGDIAMRETDIVLLKGKKEPITIYDVYEGDEDRIRELKEETGPLLREARAAYYERRFREAGEIFARAHELDPDDPVPRIYRGRCAHFLESPPPEDWNGAFRLRGK